MLRFSQSALLTVKMMFLSVILMFSTSAKSDTPADDVRGLYNAVLTHEGSNFYQYAKITLRTVNISGQLKLSANVKVLFGELDSNEYLTYEYPDVPLNFLTREISIRHDANDVSMIGILKTGTIQGEWFSTQVGRVGAFKAQKTGVPPIPEKGVLVRSLSGYYRGSLKNTNPQSNLPELISMSFVTTQDTGPDGAPGVRISGKVRFYFGRFDSIEFVETSFSDIRFNFYTRYLTAKTQDYGMTFKGIMTPNGQFNGVVLSDALGEVGTVTTVAYP